MAFDFPASPTIGQVYNNYVWDGEKWTVSSSTYGAVRYDIDQGLTAAQQSQGRANISVTKKNYIINGAMMISQENGATASTASSFWPADMFMTAWSANGLTVQQVASPTPAGSPNRLRMTVTTPKTSVAGTDYTTIYQCVEGLRFADLRWGSAVAKTVTLAFGCKGPAGTYCIAFMNATTEARNYIAEYTITAGEANTDVRKSVTVPGDVAGTWAVDNTAAVRIRWTFLVGTTFQQAAGAWGTVASAMGSANQFNLLATNGNVFELFDVSLTEGTVAPPFVVPDYPSELALCQRYYEKTYAIGEAIGTTFTDGVNAGVVFTGSTTIPGGGTWTYKTRKRVAPTLTFYDGAGTPNKMSYITGGVWTNGLNFANLAYNDTRASAMGNGGTMYGFHAVANARL